VSSNDNNLSDTIHLVRSSKGKKPQYFDDPACDKLHSMLWAVIEELSVARDRIDALERTLEQHELTSVNEVDSYIPNDAAADARAERRRDYIRRITQCFADEANQLKRADPALEFEEVVKVTADEA